MTTERTANQERAATIDPRLARIARVLGAAAMRQRPRKESPLAQTMRKALPKREKGQKPEPSKGGITGLRRRLAGGKEPPTLREVFEGPIQTGRFLKGFGKQLFPGILAPEGFEPTSEGEAKGKTLASFIRPPAMSMEELRQQPAWAQAAMAIPPAAGPLGLIGGLELGAARAVTAQAIRGIPAATKAAVLAAARGPAAQAVVPVKQAVTTARRRIPAGRPIPRNVEELADQIDQLTAEVETLGELGVRPLRPPEGVATWTKRLTNQELTAIARHENVNPLKPDWWDSLDSVVIKEAKEGRFKNLGAETLQAKKSRLAQMNRTLDHLLAAPTEEAAQTVGVAQKGMGIGEKPAQAELFEGLQGEAQRLPLASPENLAAQQARRQALAAGQAELPAAEAVAKAPSTAVPARGRAPKAVTPEAGVAPGGVTYAPGSIPPHVRASMRGTPLGPGAGLQTEHLTKLAVVLNETSDVVAVTTDGAKHLLSDLRGTFGRVGRESIVTKKGLEIDSSFVTRLEDSQGNVLFDAAKDLNIAVTDMKDVVAFRLHRAGAAPAVTEAVQPSAAAGQGLPPPGTAAPTRAGPSALTQAAAPEPSLVAVSGGAPPPLLPPTSGAAGGAAPRVPPSGLLPDLSSVDEVVGVATAPTVSRRIATQIKAVPGAKQVLNFFNPSATPSDAVEMFFDARNKLRFEGANKAATAFATLRRLGGQDAVFGSLDNKGLLTQGNLAGKALNDIRANPGKFSLTAGQREWVDAADDLERAKLDFLKRNGIAINELSFAEGGQYAGRRVYARVMPDGEVVNAAFIAPGPGRPGAKLGMERQRIFPTEAEAIEAGYRFLREDEALALNLRGAYNRVADKQVADWLLTKVPWRTTGSPEELVLAAEAAQKKVQDLAFAQQAFNRAIRGERLPTQTIDKVKRLLPDFDAGADATELKKLRRLIKPDLEAARLERQKASNIRARMRERAIRPQFATEGYVQAPAFAGKIFRADDAMKINLGLNRRESEVLAGLNSVNAIGRFYALAGDASPFTIQLIFLAGRPKLMARAALGFVKALGSTDYPAAMVARKRDIINRNPGFILASSGTEFTEFAHRGILASGPMAVAGKPLKPFARAFETALDEAGIGLLEAFEPMVKTAADREGMNAFVNQFRGLISTSRLGVSPLQRQAESLAMLAPQYNRAIAALLGSTFKGDVQGQLARRGLARGVAAVSALAVAYSLARGESPEEAARHLMPNSPDFLTWEIAGQRVGIGSKVRSVLKLLADSGEAIAQGKGDQLIELSMDNPGLRFVRGNLSPIARTFNDLLQGRDYQGDRTRDGMLQVSKTVLAENLLPIWTQTVWFEGGSLQGRAIRGAAEFFGLRAYPNSAFNDFAKYAESKTGKRYEEMSKLEKDRLKKSDARGRTLWQKYLQDQQARGRDEEVVTLLKTYRSDRIKELEEVAAYARQSGDFVKLQEAIGESGQDYAAKAKAMRQIERYAETLKRFDEMPKDAQPVDIAYNDYMAIITDPAMDDPVEGYNFAEVDRRLKALQEQIGPSLWKDVLELRELDRKDYPPEVQQYYKDQEALEPYWTTLQTALAKYPKMLAVWEQWKAMPKGAARDNFKMANGDIITTLTSLESKLRTEMRKKDAKLDAILVKWYGYTPQHDKNVLERLRERAEALK